ncbi:hypothetical protein Tco_0569621 [Tanacetum coccineum]
MLYSAAYRISGVLQKVIWQDSVQSQRGKGMLRGLGKKFYWLKLKEMVNLTERTWNSCRSWYCKSPFTQTASTLTNAAYPSNDLDALILTVTEISTATSSSYANLSSLWIRFLIRAQQIRPMLYDGNIIAKEINVISIADSEETLMLEEESRSKIFFKTIMVNVLSYKNRTDDNMPLQPLLFLTNSASLPSKKRLLIGNFSRCHLDTTPHHPAADTVDNTADIAADHNQVGYKLPAVEHRKLQPYT